MEDDTIPIQKRAERVPSEERIKYRKVDKGEDFKISKEADQKKWFHDKFTFEDKEDRNSQSSNDRDYRRRRRY